MVEYTTRQISKLKNALRCKIPASQRERIQSVVAAQTQPAIAEAMGVWLSTVNRAHMASDGGGINALKPKPIGRRRQRENMTLTERCSATTSSRRPAR
jgi:hypothetical protein